MCSGFVMECVYINHQKRYLKSNFHSHNKPSGSAGIASNVARSECINICVIAGWTKYGCFSLIVCFFCGNVMKKFSAVLNFLCDLFCV